jgi:septum formation protein
MIEQDHPLLLGSASPRRQRLLATVGIPLLVAPVRVDESAAAGESPWAYLERIAAAKLAAVVARPRGPEGALLVADTDVICDGVVLGKPADEHDARAMLRQLSGRAHEVATRFAVADASAPEARLVCETVTTTVHFRRLSEEHVRRYAATGEGRDKAGAYAIQGIGSFAVERIVGSYSNVVGLPVCEVVAALERLGLLAGFPWPSRTAYAPARAEQAARDGTPTR